MPSSYVRFLFSCRLEKETNFKRNLPDDRLVQCVAQSVKLAVSVACASVTTVQQPGRYRRNSTTSSRTASLHGVCCWLERMQPLHAAYDDGPRRRHQMQQYNERKHSRNDEVTSIYPLRRSIDACASRLGGYIKVAVTVRVGTKKDCRDGAAQLLAAIFFFCLPSSASVLLLPIFSRSGFKRRCVDYSLTRRKTILPHCYTRGG